MFDFRQRPWLFIAIAIAVIIGLTLVAAPSSSGSKNDSGSTYGGNPGGYGAWYEYMSQKPIPIERWRKPFSQFIKEDIQGVTYIQVRSKSNFLLDTDLSEAQKNWVAAGNTLVIIGVNRAATAAPFESSIPHRDSPLSEARIQIKTTRRYSSRSPKTKTILGDRYGAVVWQEEIGAGTVIYCVTPYLAANAYQNSDNYQFLAELVSQNQAIWVDEYIHGYRDRETLEKEQQDVLSYLIQTPWFLWFVQTVLIVAIAIASAFRRFGQPTISQRAIADNSTAYIDALAGVLEKANSSDFVVDAISKDEQRKLQLALGLGSSLVDEETLIAAWEQQRSESSAKLTQLLSSQGKISKARLTSFIESWQEIDREDS